MTISQSKRAEILKKLNIPEHYKLILCLDGGGVRGIFSIEMMKSLEKIMGEPIHEVFDMVAGSSTGGLIAGLLAMRMTAEEIGVEYELYVNKVFKTRGILANQILNPPKWDKINFRTILKKKVFDNTLRDVCASSDLDLLITAKDVTASEEIFFTCFKNDGQYVGTYQDVLLRAVMEATMSAPTYFSPFERFVDGGVTSHNNPSLAAIMEAIHYSGKGKYKADETVVFSFGTGTNLQFIRPKEVRDPKGFFDAGFWLKYVLQESGQDASELNTDTIRVLLQQNMNLDYRRFQVSLDPIAVNKLPDRDITDLIQLDADSLHGLDENDFQDIDFDDISKFKLVQRIGDAMGEYIVEQGGAYTRDLINAKNNRDELITARGAVSVIKKNMSDPNWVDKQPT